MEEEEAGGRRKDRRRRGRRRKRRRVVRRVRRIRRNQGRERRKRLEKLRDFDWLEPQINDGEIGRLQRALENMLCCVSGDLAFRTQCVFVARKASFVGVEEPAVTNSKLGKSRALDARK